MTDKPQSLVPRDRAEAVALFRSQVIGPLVCADLVRGQLRKALKKLSQEAYRPPDSDITRRYHWQTLEGWYYRYKNGGHEALKPQKRSDCGHAKALSSEQRELLLAIRREHPDASVPLILRTLIADGRLDEAQVAESTLRRLYREHGLDRKSLAIAAGDKVRLRWEAKRPGDLWHADVCYGPAIEQNGSRLPLRIHGILDDTSRYIVAIQACHSEREFEMLELMVKALRIHGAPGALYLDNGSTYSGHTLSLFCARLGIKLLHAKPYDPQARGKMERFWRTLRQGCLNHMGTMSSLHDVQVRLLAFIDRHYHIAAHASLMGKSPSQIYLEAVAHSEPQPLNEAMLREALTVQQKRRIRADNTVQVAGCEWQLRQGFMAGRNVNIGRCLLAPSEPPWVEYEDKKVVLERVDPKSNAVRARPNRPKRGVDAVSFDPPTVLLAKTVGRNPRQKETKR